jgi:hypothetical protein
MTTRIEQTLPAVPDDAPADLITATVDEIAEMNGDSWDTFEENGVTGSTPVQVEFAYSAPNEEAAEDLAEYLQVAAGYDAAPGSPESEFDEWTVKGTTVEVTASAAGLDEWVRRMAAVGYEHGGCQLDGWSAILDRPAH